MVEHKALRAYWSELFLTLAPHIAFVPQIVLYLLWLSAERIAQLFEAVKLFVSQKHVDA